MGSGRKRRLKSAESKGEGSPLFFFSSFNLQLVKVADGALDNWRFLEEELPKGLSVLDFYHAAEHLNKAFEMAYGVDSQNANTEFFKYRTILRHDLRGIDKVIRKLKALVKENPKKKLLKTELNYFKSNKHRCRYEELSAKHFPIVSGIVEATCNTLVSQRSDSLRQVSHMYLPVRTCAD